MTDKIIIPLSVIKNPLVGLMGVVSKDATRYAMLGVRIRVSANNINLCASDGHQASQINLSFENESKFELGEKILDPDLLKAVKAVKGESSYELHLYADKSVLCSPGYRSEFIYIEANFPNVDQIYDQNIKNISEKHYLAFNPELLLSAARSLQLANDGISKPKYAGIKMYVSFSAITDPHGKTEYEVKRMEPIVLESGSNRALIMPMRL